MRILGIDPGLRITGYGCVEWLEGGEPRIIEGGVIRIRPTLPLAQRLHQLHTDLQQIIADLSPGLLAVESLFTHPERAATGSEPSMEQVHGCGLGRAVLNLPAAGRTYMQRVEPKCSGLTKDLIGGLSSK